MAQVSGPQTNVGPEKHNDVASEGVFRPGEVLAGKYAVEGELGRGGMGVVLAARHVGLGTRVAVKVLRATGPDAKDRTRRFIREAQAAAGIESPHVARVFDVGLLDSGQPYMAMEYLDGSDGARLLETRGPLSVAEAAAALLQALDAISEAHALGIIHRDLKPSNLFFARRKNGQYTVKVLDFGVSKFTSLEALAAISEETSASTLLGTPHYMSPEQLRAARDVDARADIWSLGVILYRMVTGQHPFHGETFPELCAAIIGAPPPNVKVALPDAPAMLATVLAGCLAKSPADRYARAQDLAADLRLLAPQSVNLVGELEVPASRVSPEPVVAGQAAKADVTGGTLGTLTRADDWSEAPSAARVPKRARSWWVLGAVVALVAALLPRLHDLARSPNPGRANDVAEVPSLRAGAAPAVPNEPRTSADSAAAAPSFAAPAPSTLATATPVRPAAPPVKTVRPTASVSVAPTTVAPLAPAPPASAARRSRSEMGGRL